LSATHPCGGESIKRGQEEGLKDRPCAIILSTPTVDVDPHVYVLPITHSPPLTPDAALEIPPA